jgi:hypothetical protein
MTKEKALEASRALDNIEGFGHFIDKVEQAFNEASDLCDMRDFYCTLMDMLEKELQRRKNVLENL